MYLRAYNELQYDRPSGGFIPWSSLIKWCEANGIHEENSVATVIKYIRAMEHADHKHQSEKAGNHDSRC